MTNRTQRETMLRALAPDLWVAEQAQRFYGFEMGTRMTVVRLGSGGLFVHSPVRLEAELQRQLDALGSVCVVVAPNRYHHLYVGDYVDAYPGAQILAAPGLAEKRRDLKFHAVLGNRAPELWAGQIDQIVFPLAMVNEAVFYHRASRTLLVSDLVFNMQHTDSWGTWLLFRADGAYGKLAFSRVFRLLTRDKAAAREVAEKILTWDFERVILAHGDIVERDGRAELQQALARAL